MHLIRRCTMFDSIPTADDLRCLDDLEAELDEFGFFFSIGGESSPKIRGSVYLFSIVEMPGYYKIGISTNVRQRLQAYNSAFPFTFCLKYSLTCENYKGLEHVLHLHFKDKRVKGEWFFLSETDVADCLNLLEVGCVKRYEPSLPIPVISIFFPKTLEERIAIDKKLRT